MRRWATLTGPITSPTCVILLFVSLAAAEDAKNFERVWLTDLPEQNVHVGWGQLGKHGWTGFGVTRLSVKGIYTPHGLGMHADGHVEYALDGKYRTFRGTAAMNDSVEQGGPQRGIRFRVTGDGKLLWESAGLRDRFEAQPCLVDITAVKTLALEALYDPNTQGHGNFAHSLWFEPYVSKEPPTAEQLKLFAPEGARSYSDVMPRILEIRAAFDREDFAAVETATAKLRKEEFPSWITHPRYELYDRLAAATDQSLEGWVGQLSRLERWKAAYPKSVVPRIALAMSYTGFAFQARGEDVASNVRAEGWKLFKDRIVKARAQVENPPEGGDDDPRRYTELLRVARNQGWSREEADAVFDAGRKSDPRQLQLYMAMADLLDPRWGGMPGDIAKLAKRIRTEKKDEVSSLACYSLATDQHGYYREQVFQVSQLKYADLREAITLLVGDYSHDLTYMNRVCALACAAGDKDVSRKVFPLLDGATYEPTVWGGYQRMEHWRRKLGAESVSGEELVTLTTPNQGWMNRVAFTNGAKQLVTLGERPILTHWDLQTQEPLRVQPLHAQVWAAAFNAKGTRFAYSSPQAGENGALVFLVALDESEKVQAYSGPTETPTLAAISPDDAWVATDEGNKVWIWKTDDPNTTITLDQPDTVWGIAFSPDGKRIVVSTEHGGLLHWDLKKAEQVGAPLVQKDQGPWMCRLRFLPDGKRIVSASIDGTLRLWNLDESKFEEIAPRGEQIQQMTLSPDGRYVATGRLHGDVNIYDLETRKLVHTFVGHMSEAGALAFSPDGQYLASGSADSSAKVWPMSKVPRAKSSSP